MLAIADTLVSAPIDTISDSDMPSSGLDIRFARDERRKQLASIQELTSWSVYQCENSLSELRGARVKLRLVSADDETDFLTPEPGHHSAVQWLFQNDDALHKVIIEAIFDAAMRMQAECHWDITPPLNSPDDLKRLVDLSYIDIFSHTKNGHPYFGFEFECAWDPEHGLQVLTNGLRVVQLHGDVNNTYEIQNDGGHL